MKILLSNLICSHLFGESVTPKTGVMVLKIQLCFTGINYILKYIQAENYGSPFPPLNKKIKKVIPFFSTSDFISTIVSLYHTILTFFLAIARYKVRIVWYKLIIVLIKSEVDYKVRNIKSRSETYQVFFPLKTGLYNLQLWVSISQLREKSQNCDFISHNCEL